MIVILLLPGSDRFAASIEMRARANLHLLTPHKGLKMRLENGARLIAIFAALALIAGTGTLGASEYKKPRPQKSAVKPVGEIKKPGRFSPSSHIECNADTDCQRGKICTAAKRCLEGCRKETDCPRGQYCSDGFTCVECLRNAHCPPGTVCNAVTNACVECTRDTDCGPGKRCDTAQSTCVSN